MFESFRGLRKFSRVGSSMRSTCYSVLGPSLGCHSEERSDEEAAFDFAFLIERVRKKRKADASLPSA
jgi:hypothetical protein